VTIYRFTVSCLGQREGLFTFLTRRHIWSLSDDGAYNIGFK